MGNYLANCPSGSVLTCPWYQYFWVDRGNLLPPLGGDPDTITVSGFSSGAYMATILHVIYPQTVKGLGFAEGGSYYSVGMYGDVLETVSAQ